jgi:excisionase family DNA binding protein
MSESDEIYTTGEAAKILKVSQPTVFRAIENNQLKASTTPGGHYRITRADLADYMARNNIQAASLEPRRYRILVVEDNPAEQRLIQKALSAEPMYDVRVTHSGYEAGFLTKQLKPDLLLLDIFLGDMDGRQITRLIRSDSTMSNMKIVALSSTREADVIQEVWDAGVDSFIPKPVAPDALLDQVRRFLK